MRFPIRKVSAVIFSLILCAAAICLPALAGTPKIDPSDSLITKHAAGIGFGFNGGAKIRDRVYEADYNIETAGGLKVVTRKSADEAEAAGQIYLWSAGTASASGACGFVATGPDGLKNIAGEKDTAESIYCATVQFEIDGGFGETPVGSFCIVMGPDSARWGKKLNGFDIWLGTEQDAANGNYKLAYHADNLVTLNLWETSDDGRYSYFEADFEIPEKAGYAILAFTKDNLLTTYESFIPGMTNEGELYYSFLLGEFAVFSKTLDGKDLLEEETTEEVTTAEETTAGQTTAGQTTAEQTTEASVTDAPAGDTTDAPAEEDTTAPQKTGGCSSSAVLAPLFALAAAAPALMRRRRR